MTSTAAPRSSRTNVAMRSPLRVYLRLSAGDDAAHDGTSRPLASRASSANGQSTWRRSARSAPSSGWSLTYRPSISFSNASRCAFGYSSLPGSARCSSNPKSTPAALASANRLMIPASRSRRRASVALDRSARARRRAPLRGWPSESNAPALASDSTVRLFSAAGVDAVAEVVEVGERPALVAGRARSARRRLPRRCAPPTGRTGSPCCRRRRARTVKSWSDSLTSGTSTGMPSWRHSLRNTAVWSLFALHAREQRGEVLDRVVRLQVGGLVREVAVPDRVRLVERVVGERLDRVEDAARRTRGRGPARRIPRRTSCARSRSARGSFLPVALRRLSASSSE